VEIEEDYKSELLAFGQRVKARREAGLYSPVWIRKEWLILNATKEKYAPWHLKNVLAHPRRTWRMAFGTITDAEWEGILAHMDDKGTGNGSKKGKQAMEGRVLTFQFSDHSLFHLEMRKLRRPLLSLYLIR
jgi:hypothetical protein